MQRAWLIPVSVAVLVGVIIASAERPSADEHQVTGLPLESAAGVELLTDVDGYVDPDYGFSLAIPNGWTAVVMPESEEEMSVFEPGYAVGFHSPPEHEHDRFTDYLMIEILPGDESGLFVTDGSRRAETLIDGRIAWRDSLALPADDNDDAAVDLVVRQAVTSGLGYTIGFYAIGEPARTSIIDDAFEIMLRSFELNIAPFDVS